MTEQELRELIQATLQEKIKPITMEMGKQFADVLGNVFQIGFETGYNAGLRNAK